MNEQSQEKLNSLFDKIAIWNLGGDQKTEVAETIIKDVETGIEYWSQMVLSSIIASLGLLINATPVVIGAMLIAPILRPIQAVAFATTTGNKRLFWKGLWLLISSIAVGIISAILITRLIPLSELTNEILMRTQPTLIDLGIAFASGCVAFLAFGFKRIAAGLAGVAMAASLVPPLAVVGIGIGMLNFSIGRGSRILFLTNLVAIILAGIIIFYLFGYYPNQKKEIKTSLITTAFSLVIMIALSIPLATSLFSIIDDINDKSMITKTSKTYLDTVGPGISIENISYNGTMLSLGLRAPASTTISLSNKTILSEKIAQALGNPVELDLSIIPYISASNKTIQKTPTEHINGHIDTFLEILYPPVIRTDTQLLTQKQRIVIAEFYTEEQFNTTRFKEQLEQYLIEKNAGIDTVIINWQNVGKNSTELSASEQQRQAIQKTLESSFNSTFETSYLHTLTLLRGEKRNTGVASLVVTTPLSSTKFEEQLTQWKETATQLAEMNIEIKSIIHYGDEISVE